MTMQVTGKIAYSLLFLNISYLKNVLLSSFSGVHLMKLKTGNQTFHQRKVWRKWLYGKWFYSCGLHRSVYISNVVIFVFLSCLYFYHCWKSWHDCINQDWFTTPDTYVLLHESSFSFKHVLFIYNCFQNFGEFLSGQKDNFVCWMHHSVILLCSLCYHWGLPTGCHGLWPLCCSLQASALHSCHVTECLWEVTGRGICHRCDELRYTFSIFRLPFCHFHKINHFFCTPNPSLLRHSFQWETSFCCGWIQHLDHHRSHSSILFVCPRHCAEYPYYWRQVQSVLHLCFPLGHRYIIVWKCPFHVFTSKLKLFPRSGQGGFCVVLSYNPHAYPLIYSMRNNKVKDALRRTRSKFHSSWCQWNQVVQSQQKQYR